MPETFHDLPILGELGDALDTAMARETEDEAPASASQSRARRRFPNPFRTLAIALLLAGLGTSTAAATLTVLRGSPIPVPRKVDLQADMTPKLGTGQVLGVRADQPGGGAPYALRTSRSETGLACVTVGQSQDGRFGVVGTDGAFRDLPAEIIDGCGQPTKSAPAVMGARVFDDPERAAVRTVLYGLGGSDLERASVRVRGAWQPLEVTDGAFLLGLRDYPEDSGLVVKLDYAGGTSSSHPLGIAPTTVVDPTGPAWRIQGGSVAGWSGLCVSVGAARYDERSPRSPQLCGRTRGPRDSRPTDDYFFGARTLRPGDAGGNAASLGRWAWRDGPPRTMVYGYADPKEVEAIRVLGGLRPVKATRIAGNGQFLAILPATVDASDVTAELTFTDGSTRRLTGDQNVITPTRERTR
ncbi:MAG: hypothetical protein Q7T55_10155 [Solirubrobacteraceae bacterium]|nr:hypothetical protein [Solirubrobacteraceae bacterium]